MGCLNFSLDAKHDMRAYLILYSVKWKYWNDLVSNVFGFVFGKMKVLEWLGREKAILVYMHINLINRKFELIPWCETWYVNLFCFVLGKMKVLEWLCPENDILVYMPTSLLKGKFEIVPWCETWYVNLFCFKFGKMKVLKWPLSRKRDFSLYGYNFDKYEGWTCPMC